MRRFVACMLLICVAPLSVWASLRIDAFDVTLTLQEDGRLLVEERLQATFTTSYQYHGLEREIPISYRNAALGTRMSIDFDLLDVHLDGSEVPLSMSRSSGYQVLRIGDANQWITGTHVYTIMYRVANVLLFHDDYVQLYWNVTGNEWRVPIASASARLLLPDSMGESDVASVSYVGASGSTTRGDDGIWDNGALTFSASNLTPGLGLTIDVSVARDALGIQPPTVWENTLRFLKTNGWAGLPIIVLIGMFVLWLRKGRDPKKRVIAPAFAPPTGTHAGLVGTLIDDRVDLRDVTAMVIELAVDGYLRIEEIGADDEPPAHASRIPPTDYRMHRLDKDPSRLAPVQRLLLDALMDDEKDVLVSSLAHRFYVHLPSLKSKLYGELIERGDYAQNPERVRSLYVSVGVFGLGAGAALAFLIASLALGLSVAACGLIVLAFSPIMPRKTVKGVRAYEEVLGLAQYIRKAEVDRIEFHNAPEKSPQLFERLLPYAIALNLTSIWTRQFEGLLTQPPDWYVGPSRGFHAHLFALSMMNVSRGMTSAMSSAPRTSGGGRSAWGGGASFGGGFSGGGFGGGGGGGW